ncbi:MAG: hypothetical protein EPO09_01910, partial [Aquabacterium sp.]
MHLCLPASSFPTSLPLAAPNGMGRYRRLRAGEPGRHRSAPLRLALTALGATLIAATAQAALPSAVMTALEAANVPPEAVSMLVLPVEGSTAPRLEHEAQAVRQIA